MSAPADHQPSKKPMKAPAVPRPSASVLLISPTNQILLLHRVSKASSFASAHVFPGGALSKTHDGEIPDVDDPGRHQDGPAYRVAAVRETFEECGILLAKSKKTGRLFTEISDEEREQGRKDVHSGKVKFGDLLERWGAEPDTRSLIPFTRWVTPGNVPKRFSTQMYIYFLPLGSVSPTKHAAPRGTPPSSGLEEEDEIVIPKPTHDGGIEHTAARFLPPNKWIDLARQNRIILFPPQFFLTLLLSPYLASTVTSPTSPTPSLAELQVEREKLLDFLKKPRTYNGKPEVSFAEACISPLVLGKGEYGQSGQDGVGGVDKYTAVLVLDKPGKEVDEQGQGRKGIMEWVVTTKFKGEGPRDVDVRRRDEVLGNQFTRLSGFNNEYLLEPGTTGPWEGNIYATNSRTVRPRSVFTLRDRHPATYPRTVALRGNGTNVIFDFGVEVGGIASLTFSSNGTGAIGLAFSEALNWVGEWSDTSNGKFEGRDGALYVNISAAGPGTYTMPDKVMRGGFRYMTVFLITDTGSWVTITDVQLELSFQPTWSNLRAYQGYFYCNDELLNRIWYAGAYTLQTNAVPTNTGRWVPMLANGWANNGTLGPGSSIIVDGAKRDRAVWPGDMGIAVPSSFVSTGDLESVKNALQVMFDYQNKDGSFPEAGPPLLQQNSDTYHMWTMIGTYNYMLYTGDAAFVEQNWAAYTKGMEYIYGKVDETGLLNQTGTRDWARWQTGFNNTEANIILFHTLQTGSLLANWLNTSNTNLSEIWSSRATALQTAITTHCFDDLYGAFRDNATDTTLHPQDANSLSLLFSLVPPTSPLAAGISTALTKNWTPIGAEPPELPGNISPFISSFEIQAHFLVNRADRALDLIRRSWGWYADNRNGNGGSTVIEGYRTDGTFGYRSERGYGGDASYVSHAHGWSSGPTSALTEFVAGLRVLEPAGMRWRCMPHFGDLERARAGFLTRRGRFEVVWLKGPEGYEVQLETPVGTDGEIRLPVLEGEMTVMVDGVARGEESYKVEEGYVVLEGVEGGKYDIRVSS
ncbi:glycoside hydrolase family 78 protein [Stemphylium lycopersici]|uniref:Glycoside hydrolase family 78 protein n=1 Tax=Stemphylium lycopersici TaxID=183478 RepID=A0A364N7A5_STELY|nr:glycoside hydrolase family 78 protein [Stemphylium lycopersici]